MGNTVSTKDLEPGDPIYRYIEGGLGAYHYGIYVGDGKVIHFDKQEGVMKSSFDKFSTGKRVWKNR